MYTKFKKTNDYGRLKIKDNYLNKFIDFNKSKMIFYNNLYLDDFKIVIKMPLNFSRKGLIDDIKIEQFNLSNSIYLFSYD